MSKANPASGRRQHPAEPRFDLGPEVDIAPPSGALTLIALAYKFSLPLLLLAVLLALAVVVLQLGAASKRADKAADAATQHAKDAAALSAQVKALAEKPPAPAKGDDQSEALREAIGRLDKADESLQETRTELEKAKKSFAEASAELRTSTTVVGKQKNILELSQEFIRLRAELEAAKQRALEAEKKAAAMIPGKTDPKEIAALEEQRKAAVATAMKAEALIKKLDEGKLDKAVEAELKQLRDDVLAIKKEVERDLKTTTDQMAALARRFDAIEKRFQTPAQPMDVQLVALNTEGFNFKAHTAPFERVLGQSHGRFAGCRFGFTVLTNEDVKHVVALGDAPDPKAFDLLREPVGAVAKPDEVRAHLDALFPPPPAKQPAPAKLCVLATPLCDAPDPKLDWKGVRVDALLIDHRGEAATDPKAADQLKGWVVFCAARGGTVAVLNAKSPDFAKQLEFHLRRLAQPQ